MGIQAGLEKGSLANSIADSAGCISGTHVKAKLMMLGTVMRG